MAGGCLAPAPSCRYLSVRVDHVSTTLSSNPASEFSHCPETRAAHGASEGWSSGGCEGMFVTESSALARGRDCLETRAAHGASEGWSSGGCEGVFVTESSALARRRDCPEIQDRAISRPKLHFRTFKHSKQLSSRSLPAEKRRPPPPNSPCASSTAIGAAV